MEKRELSEGSVWRARAVAAAVAAAASSLSIRTPSASLTVSSARMASGS
jgi:hypothetical protein